MMDQEQDRRFRAAVDRKNAEAQAAARATAETPPGGESGVQGDQESLRSPGRPQDAFSVRDKSSRHGKVTADKWNQ